MDLMIKDNIVHRDMSGELKMDLNYLYKYDKANMQYYLKGSSVFLKLIMEGNDFTMKYQQIIIFISEKNRILFLYDEAYLFNTLLQVDQKPKPMPK